MTDRPNPEAKPQTSGKVAILGLLGMYFMIQAIGGIAVAISGGTWLVSGVGFVAATVLLTLAWRARTTPPHD